MRCHATVPDGFTYRAALGVGDEPAASAGITSLSGVTAPCQRAGCAPLRVAVCVCGRASSTSRRNISVVRPAIRACDGPAAPVGITSPSGDAAPCHRAGCVHLRCCHLQVRRACSTGRHNISVKRLRRHAIAPDVFTHSAAIRVRDGPAAPAGLTSLSSDCGAMPSRRRCSPTVRSSARTASQPHPLASHLSRARRCQAIVPDVFTHRAAIDVCDVPAAPAGITSLSNGAAPCHRTGCVYLLCCHLRKCNRAGGGHLRLLIPACRHSISFERCGAMPLCRMRSHVHRKHRLTWGQKKRETHA